MTKGLFIKRNGIKKILFCACFAMSTMMFSTTVVAQTLQYNSTTDKAEEEDFEYFEGKVTYGVNIRVDAGADKDKVMVDGKGVSLSKGTIVTIIGSKKVGSKPWYQIRFTYGDKELEGFATSTYIEKTGVVITPTPMPTPTPEPTPEPTIAPEPTPEPVTVNPTMAPTEETQTDKVTKESGNTVKYISVAIAIIAVAGGGIYFFLRRKKDGEQAVHVSEKVAKLKGIVISSKVDNKSEDKVKDQYKDKDRYQNRDQSRDQGRDQGRDKVIVKDRDKDRDKDKEREKENEISLEDKKRQEGRISKRDKILRQIDAANKSEVYVIKSKADKEQKDLGLAVTLDVIDLEECVNDKEHNPTQQENTDKKSLRTAINGLKQHDIILHKFFGKGEVYDNSDVRLIEVRFGSDVRFLNKEQLVNKKLIQITNEKAQ